MVTNAKDRCFQTEKKSYPEILGLNNAKEANFETVCVIARTKLPKTG